MPSPVGHSLAGFLITRFAGERFAKHPLRSGLFVVGMTNLPDLDFLPGLLIGSPGVFHRYASHSLGVAALVASAVGLFCWFRYRKFLATFLLTFLLYGSHILLDSFAVQAPGKFSGTQAFWPLSEELFAIPLPLFLEIRHSEASVGFVRSLLTWHNLGAVLWEVGVLLLAAMGISALREGPRRRRSAGALEVFDQ